MPTLRNPRLVTGHCQILRYRIYHVNNQWYRDGLRFTCTQCGNCCTGPPGFVWFDSEEAAKIAEFLGLSVDAFLQQYAHKVDGRWTLNETKAERGFDCVFLQRDEGDKALCSIYEVRPAQCRTWPFWPENLRSGRAWRAAAKTCPGMEAGLNGQGKFYPVEQVRIIRDSTPSM